MDDIVKRLLEKQRDHDRWHADVAKLMIHLGRHAELDTLPEVFALMGVPEQRDGDQETGEGGYCHDWLSEEFGNNVVEGDMTVDEYVRWVKEETCDD